MSSEFLRKNITIKGHRTSISLERSIWSGLEELCDRESINFNQLFTLIESLRNGASRTSAVRTFIVNYYRSIANISGTGSGEASNPIGDDLNRLMAQPIEIK